MLRCPGSVNAFDSVHLDIPIVVDLFSFHIALQGAHRIQDRHAERRMTSIHQARRP